MSDNRVKLTDAQVSVILAYQEVRRITNQDIAEELGCSRWHVQAIRQGKKRQTVDVPAITPEMLVGWLQLCTQNQASQKRTLRQRPSAGISSQGQMRDSES